MRKTLGKLSSLLLSVVLIASAVFPVALSADEICDYTNMIEIDSEVFEYEVGFYDNILVSDVSVDTVPDFLEALFEFREFVHIEEIEITMVESSHEYAEIAHEIFDDRLNLNMVSPFRAPMLDSQIILDADGAVPMQEFSAYHLLSTDISQFNAGITPLNTNPNLAIHIPESLFGLPLQDLANHQERWYRFDVPANRKITTVLYYNSGIYDLGLFRLSGTTLNLVAHSVMGGGFERINFISQSGGTYFLAVVPFVPAPVPHLFSFAIFVSGNFDTFELNNNPNSATAVTNAINLHANLNNPYDEDWFRLNVTAGGVRDIALLNAPVGQHYAVILYDNNLNIIGSFFADNTVRSMNFPTGTYYIRVLSLSGIVVDSNYWLRVTDANHRLFIHNGQVFDLLPGQRAIVFNNQVFILQANEDAYVFGNQLFIISLLPNGGGFVINGSTPSLSGPFGNIGRSLFTIRMIPSSFGTQPIGIHVYNTDWVVLEFDVVGFIRHPMPHLRPPFWYFDSYDSQVYQNQSTRVDRITAWICLFTRQIVHAEWFIIPW